MLRIFSAFAYLSVVGILVLGALGLKCENPQVEQILQRPGIIQRFEDINNKQDKPAEEGSPLVVQARVFSSYLTAPPPSEKKDKEKVSFAVEQTPSQSTPIITKPPAPPAPSAKFKVLGTSYYPNQPERSMALIWQPGSNDGYERWVKEGSRLDHFIVHKIKRGVVVYRDNQQRTYEMAIEKQNTTNDLVKKHLPGVTIAQGEVSRLPAPGDETDSNSVSK
ncbi:MAG: hypothetical protein JW837_00215 [Sedimentisphaerales bacterium]|nr:hypothetical protein [Sedimentisphaerales bacterium]